MITPHNRHLWRLGLVITVGIGVFLWIRSQTIPDDFGRDGPYRPGALADNAALPVVLPAVSECVKCHEKAGATIAESPHRQVHCSHCHGVAAEHARTEEIADVVSLKDKAVCAVCHAQVVGRPSDHPQIDIHAHLEEQEPDDPSAAAVCFECHEPHDPAP